MSVKSLIIRKASRSLLQVQKYSPEILTGLGLVGGVTSSIMAAKATLQVEEVLDDHKNYVETAKNQAETKEEQTKALAYVYTKTALKLGKLYGPSFSLGLASVGCILSAHGIMRRRNAALIASYKVLESAFSEYRSRVEAEVGGDREKELYFNIQEKEVEAEDGSKSVVKTSGPFAHSEYAKCFDQLNPNWRGNPEYNLYFLRAQQNFANDLLKSRGHMFLNDVYDQLGLPRTKAGAVVGWVLGNGDDYVDFGIYDINRPMALEFVNGHESAIWLDFNVDGIIYDLI